jgi:hypothetical protein
MHVCVVLTTTIAIYELNKVIGSKADLKMIAKRFVGLWRNRAITRMIFDGQADQEKTM